MNYSYMSNINNFSDVTSSIKAYQKIKKYDGKDQNGIIDFNGRKANFLMIRAHSSNNLLIELYSTDNNENYGVFIPAGELWSVDSLFSIEKIIIKDIFILGKDNENNDTETQINNEDENQWGYIQWMIGYK